MVFRTNSKLKKILGNFFKIGAYFQEILLKNSDPDLLKFVFL